MEKQQENRKIVLILFIASFIIRLIFILTLKKEFYFDDESEYYRMIQNFFSGKGLIAGEHIKGFRPPLYPLIASIFYYFKLGITGIRIFQVFLSSLTVPLIYLIGEKGFSKKVGIVSGIISIFYPFFIFYNGFLLTETLFLFLVVLTFYIFVNLEKNIKYYIFAGITLGLAGLCRPTMQSFLPFILFLILMTKEAVKPKLQKSFILLLFFSLTISPWVIRNYTLFKKVIPGTTMGGYVFWEGNNPNSDGGPCQFFPENIMLVEETERDQILYKMTFDVIKENPKRFVWLLANKFKRFWNIVPNALDYTKPLYKGISIMSFGVMMPFFLLGFFLTLKKRGAQFMHLLIVFFTIFHIIFLASIRYRLPIEPFYIILAVYGFFKVKEWVIPTIKRDRGGC